MPAPPSSLAFTPAFLAAAATRSASAMGSSRGPSDMATRVLPPEVRRRFAASTAGAKERVAQLGAHRQMRDDAAPGPLTQASAPKAPGRLGREDARNFGGGALGVDLDHYRLEVRHLLQREVAADPPDAAALAGPAAERQM